MTPKPALDRDTAAALDQFTLILGTRASPMALCQARRVAQLLNGSKWNVRLVELSTSGDRLQDRSIEDLEGRAPFADDIEHALLQGTIDLAVHSLKDLPDDPTPGLTLAAILPRDDAREALVSRQYTSLAELPAGALVGTSAPRRTAQLLRQRPDLHVAWMRGPVEKRVAQVLDGKFEAAILAVAGLERLGLTKQIAEILPTAQFLPAAGQGALAIQARVGDQRAQQACAPLDDPATRRTTAAELAFQSLARSVPDTACAAHATGSAALHLHARLLALDGSSAQDVVSTGRDPVELARSAFERLAHWPHLKEPVRP